MTKTQKILIAIGVGVGVAYIYKRYYKKGKSTTGTTATSTTKEAQGTFKLPEESVADNLSREEKEEFILDNVSATPQEVSSGFEGTRFVWNPTLERMYPVGTIQEGYEPTFGEIYNSAEGDVVADIPKSVENSENSLKDLNDQELELLYRITKTMRNSPSIMSEEDAVKEMGVTNPNIIKIVRQKLKKRLNDIKIMKKDANWNAKWNERKEKRKKRRNEFKEKMGFNKDRFDKITAKKCGRKPRKGQVAQYKKCVETIADAMRSKIKGNIRAEVSNAPVSVKDDINNRRQKSFAKQMTNRSTGGIYGGERWDGESNAYVENLVDKGLV
jgi:ABC-type dipeptide/oligopeptide/nickel transport system ATPase subunit